MLLLLVHLVPGRAQAKEFEIDGTIDCGRPSGMLCLPLGPSVGVITDQITGKRERFEVGIGLILEQRLKKTKVGRLLLEDTEGIYRTMLFAQLKPLMDQLAKFDPTELSQEEKERLVDELFDKSLPRKIVSARDKLIIVSQNFKQDARVRVVVTDGIAPILVATEVVEYHDYQMSQRRSSGTQNLGQLTGTDSESFVCTDFVEEGLDFAKERIQEEGKLELTDNEELFFDLLADLPLPCVDKEEGIDGARRQVDPLEPEGDARPVDEAAQGEGDRPPRGVPAPPGASGCSPEADRVPQGHDPQAAPRGQAALQEAARRAEALTMSDLDLTMTTSADAPTRDCATEE